MQIYYIEAVIALQPTVDFATAFKSTLSCDSVDNKSNKKYLVMEKRGENGR